MRVITGENVFYGKFKFRQNVAAWTATLAILVGRTIVGLRDTTAAPWATRAVPVVWAAVVLIDVGLGGTATLWSPARFETAALAAQTKHACAPTEPIIALGVGAPAASYEAHRRVRPVRSGAHLPALIDAAPNASVCVLATTETIPSIPDALTVLQLGPTPSGEPSTVVLLRVTR